MANPIDPVPWGLFAAVLVLASCFPSEEPTNEDVGEGDGHLAECLGGTKIEDDPEVALDDEELAFLESINAYRVQNGLKPLEACRSLHRASHDHSVFQREQGKLAHIDDEGREPSDRACEACYNGGCFMNAMVGENLAAGNPEGKATFEQWKASPGHDANMRRPEFRVIGIGRVLSDDPYRAYWTTVFGSDDEPSCD